LTWAGDTFLVEVLEDLATRAASRVRSRARYGVSSGNLNVSYWCIPLSSKLDILDIDSMRKQGQLNPWRT
jgi:hypothetical protein